MLEEDLLKLFMWAIGLAFVFIVIPFILEKMSPRNP